MKIFMSRAIDSNVFLHLILHPSCGWLCLWLHSCGACSTLVMKGMKVGEVAFELGFERFPESNSCGKCWQAALIDHV